ncbi:histamine N-methyltransferase-like [Saccoglossus kowalevskii]
MIESFQKTVEDNKELSDVTFDWIMVDIDTYKKSHQEEEFHLITMMNVLEYVNDVDDMLAWICNSVADNGTAILTVSADNNILSRLWEHFPDLIGTYLKQSVQGSDIEARLKSITTTVDVIKSDFTIEFCCNENSLDGNLVLDFLTHKINFRKTASPVDIQRVLSFLFYASAVNSEKQEGNLVLPNGYNFVIVSK